MAISAQTIHPAIAEEQLAEWTHRAYRDEDKRAERTERLVREAISAHPLLSTLPISVYAKGSYKNNTNVRRDSDIDVAVEYQGLISLDTMPGVDVRAVWTRRGLHPYAGPLPDRFGRFDTATFKAAVGEALALGFAPAVVGRSNKVFTVAPGERSLAADIVPCVTYDLHFAPDSWVSGIQLLPDRTALRPQVNFPAQHLRHGIEKNTVTLRRFKRVVRILKNLENLMVADGVCAPVASYLVESLVYNVPGECFAFDTWGERVRAVLIHIWAETEGLSCERSWLEVNRIKLLFHAHQAWNRGEARAFVAAAWPYLAGG